MSLVSVAEVRALVQTDLSDDDLQDVIDREEAWLAGRIGALTGARTETYWPDYDAVVMLRRRASTVAVEDNGVAVSDVRFTIDGSYLRRTLGYWTTPVEATYTPNDESEVKAAVIDLVAIRVTDGPYDSEQIGEYGYTRGSARKTRLSVARSLLPHRPATSMRIRSSLEATR